MICREPTDHVTDCYFCLLPSIAKGLLDEKKNGKFNIQTFHQLINKDILIPEAPESYAIESDDGEVNETSDPESPTPVSEPQLITQNGRKELVRDFGLPKSKAKLLHSRLQQWNYSLVMYDFQFP